jgi:hypothetical protein
MDLLGTISLSFPGSSRITHRPHINITLASCVLFTIVVHNPRTDHRPWASVNSNSDDRNSQVDYPYGSYNARTCPPSPTLALATNDDDDNTGLPATPTLGPYPGSDTLPKNDIAKQRPYPEESILGIPNPPPRRGCLFFFLGLVMSKRADLALVSFRRDRS